MITSQLLAGIFPNTPQPKRDRFISALNKFCPKYGIDSYLRICAFLATGGVETDYLRVTVEYASGADYEGRSDLGNTQEGDGRKFKGRGFFQTTGRYNYSRVNRLLGKLLGIDFLKNPEKLAEIEIAVESACIFWRENNLAKYADAGQFKELSAVVNCGNPKAKPNHWAKRNELYSLCKRRVPQNFSFSSPLPIVSVAPNASSVSTGETSQGSATAPDTTVSTDTGSNSPVAAAVAPESSVKRFLNKYILHCPTDSAKNVILVVFARISTWTGILWKLGFHGKILCFLIAFGAIVPLVYAIVKYKSRIWGWIESIAENFLKE